MREMRTHGVPISVCVSCGAPNDMATDTLEGEQPNPGDISVCFTCGHLTAFADDLTLRPLTDKEMYDIAGHPMVIALGKAREKKTKKIRGKR